MRQHFLKAGVGCLVLLGLIVGSLAAAITPEQRKELKEITNDITKANSLITKKKYEDAGTAIEEIEEKLATFIKDADLKDTDPVLKPVKTQLSKAKEKLAKSASKRDLTFQKNVAAIFANKCVGCHGEDEPKGGLRLDTFEGVEKGGKSGDLVAPGNPEGSLLVQRLISQNDQLRMPKGDQALSEKEITGIVNWINEGANFEGDKTATMVALVKAAKEAKPMGPAKKNDNEKEGGKGKEKKDSVQTIHFMQDIMPELVDTCGRCHNDTVKRSGFSVMSFDKLMKGGNSGAVITPGDLDKSRLWRLLNGPDDGTPIMPAGNQTGITRPWYENMKTWILEGAKFDGGDRKKNFPSLEERQSSAMAKFSPQQWNDRRKTVSEAAWKKTYPTAAPVTYESNDFLMMGDVTSERLEQLEKWAAEQLAYLKQTFKVKDETIWKGKLAVFVFKERFGYEEFNHSVHSREVPREVIGHSQVTSSGSTEDAFIALQDVGDSTSDSSPGMQVNLIDNLTGAFFKRGGGKLPDWLVHGAGLAMAHHRLTGNPYLVTLPRLAGGIVQDSKLNDPAQIFAEGTFSPSDIGPVGFTLVEFLMKRGSTQQFGLFVAKLQSGSSVDASLKEIYQSDGRTMAQAYAGTLPAGSKKGKK